MIRWRTDYCTERGAKKLAGMIVNYWRRRGDGNVIAEVLQCKETPFPLFSVRTNLVGGLPPDARNSQVPDLARERVDIELVPAPFRAVTIRAGVPLFLGLASVLLCRRPQLFRRLTRHLSCLSEPFTRLTGSLYLLSCFLCGCSGNLSSAAGCFRSDTHGLRVFADFLAGNPLLLRKLAIFFSMPAIFFIVFRSHRAA
jgi:hypothetical protein